MVRVTPRKGSGRRFRGPTGSSTDRAGHPQQESTLHRSWSRPVDGLGDQNGRSAKPGGLQRPAYGDGVRDRARAVAVQADRVDRAARASAWATIASSSVDQRARLRARHQPAVRRCSRGPGSPRGRPPARRPPPASAARPASRAPAGRPSRRAPPRLLLVVEHPVVERAVRLEVAHRRARGRGDLRRACPPGRRPARAARRARRRGRPGRSSRGRRTTPGRRPTPRAGPPPRRPRA